MFNAQFSAGRTKEFIVLPKKTSAIPLIPDRDGRIQLGTLLQLPEGARVEFNGEGFNPQTARVVWEGTSYYIFLDDIEQGSRYKVATQSAG